RRHHCARANASPVSNTWWMPQWNAAGTRVSSACVSATGSVSVSRPAVPRVSRAGSSEPSTSDSEGSLSIPVQNESSPTHAASCARDESRCDHRRNEVPRAGNAGTSPRAIAAPPPPHPPPPPPKAQAPGGATPPRQPQDDGYPAADDRTDAPRHQTTPPAPLPQPQAKAGSPPRALARRCTPHAPQHQDHQCRSVGGSPPHPPPQPAPPPAASPPL